MTIKEFTIKDKSDGYWTVSLKICEADKEIREDITMVAFNHTGQIDASIILEISTRFNRANNTYSVLEYKQAIENYTLKISA